MWSLKFGLECDDMVVSGIEWFGFCRIGVFMMIYDWCVGVKIWRDVGGKDC